MLRVFTGARGRDGGSWTRRDFIEAGTLGLGGLTLAGLLGAKAQARAKKLDFVRDRSVVLLFLSGGASQIETFDPHGDSPAPYRSLTGEVPTTIAGLSFGGTFPRLARLAHRMAVVRSFQHRIGGHVEAIVHVLSGGTDPQGLGKDGTSIGALCTSLRGAHDPRTGVPTYALLNSAEVDPQYRNERERVERGSRPLALGPAFAPFAPNGSGPAVADMRLSIGSERLTDRRSLLGAMDRLRRELETSEGLAAADENHRKAFELLLGGAAFRAFDLESEDPKVLARYDTSAIEVGHKRFRPSDLGHLMLSARRLCEAGCGFVTVHSAGWDMHADVNNPGMVEGMGRLGTAVDIAVSAFLDDLEARGLSEKLLLIITGDFGRTPSVNKGGGRDHWPKLSTLAFAGGGLRMGQVIGRSTRQADAPATEPITPPQLLSTVLHTVFDPGALRIADGIPRLALEALERDPPIRELI